MLPLIKGQLSNVEKYFVKVIGSHSDIGTCGVTAIRYIYWSAMFMNDTFNFSFHVVFKKPFPAMKDHLS